MNSLTGRLARFVFGGAALLLAGGIGWAGSTSDQGTSSGIFLKIPVSARSSSLGGAVTAVTDEAGVLAWNPAGMVELDKRQVLLSHAPSPEGTATSNAYFVHPAGAGAWGVGVTYFSAGAIDETEPTVGATVGTFRPSDAAATVGYARKVARWDLGLALKGVQSKIIESDSTLAFDGGILSPKFWQDRLRLGVSALNTGGSLQLGNTARPLPFQIAVGVGLTPNEKWTLSSDLKFPRDNDPFFCIGGEGVFPVGPDWRFAGRAGWEGSMDTGLGDFAGFNMGFGVSKGALGLDYAVSPMGDLGQAHRVSLAYSF